MNREAILEEYRVDAGGIIRSPGRFEGTRLYAPYFWEAYLNGAVDDTEDGVNEEAEISVFKITPDDIKAFPELNGVSEVRLWTDDQGFVYLEETTNGNV